MRSRARLRYGGAVDIVPTTLGLATVQDADAIARLSRQEIEHGLPWRWRPDAIRRLIAAPETSVLCARCEIGGETTLGGFAAMEFSDERAHLVLLAVEPALRRKGMARALLRWLEKSARVWGAPEIRLEVRVGNTGAQKFYIVEGYRRGRYLPGFYQGVESAYRMVKKLA